MQQNSAILNRRLIVQVAASYLRHLEVLLLVSWAFLETVVGLVSKCAVKVPGMGGTRSALLTQAQWLGVDLFQLFS